MAPAPHAWRASVHSVAGKTSANAGMPRIERPMNGGRSSGYLYPLRHPVFLRVEERTEGTADGGETPAPPPASEPKRGGRKTLVIVIAIVIVAAALGGAVLYLSQRGPEPSTATLHHVAGSA